ncbi:MBL fold metallo-hydrolase [Enterobacter sp. Ap-1006]|uniref:MBL fold metallo-hydrolase n=1 Tax=Enterobacter sp. Ap-1006 TaxID=2608345 RepID=UPI00141FD3FD|nr:MBL fold metallo-hydrolase [Enterobacter sp. Ap-1006]NIF46995.1 MBL fold metallo-hydrolase [Enterobacter sp. Ap-1006]
MSWKNPWYNPQLSHHLPDGFCNAEPAVRQPGDVQRWRQERKAQNLPHPPGEGYSAFIERWWQQAELSGSDDRIWWLGHASLLLRLNGHFLLTDPVFSRRASPVSFAGPVRRTEVPLDLNQLPRLDAVLISHNHYDHLDKKTVRRLIKRFPDVHFFVPLGLKAWFSQRGIEQVTELDWWQSFNWCGMVFTAVPARHWSMRTFWDRNRSLWCGWVVEQGNLRFWFSGDSGYTPSLAEIAKRLGPFDMAALPIGAYEPRWFMGDHHMDPQQAVTLWQAIGKPETIPIHWGVFELADESLDKPPQELLAALREKGESDDLFSPLRIGQSLPLTKNKN